MDTELSKTETVKRAAQNSVIFWNGSQVIATFNPKTNDKGKTTPAAIQAKEFRDEILNDEEHPLHEILKSDGFWSMNGHPELIKPKMGYGFN